MAWLYVDGLASVVPNLHGIARWVLALGSLLLLFFSRQIFQRRVKPEAVGWFLIWIWFCSAIALNGVVMLHLYQPPSDDTFTGFERSIYTVVLFALAVTAGGIPMFLGVLVLPSRDGLEPEGMIETMITRFNDDQVIDRIAQIIGEAVTLASKLQDQQSKSIADSAVAILLALKTVTTKSDHDELVGRLLQLEKQLEQHLAQARSQKFTPTTTVLEATTSTHQTRPVSGRPANPPPAGKNEHEA